HAVGMPTALALETETFATREAREHLSFRIRDRRSHMPSTTVKDVMTSGPTSIASDAMVVEAARRMLSADVGSLPVVDGDALVGMITDRDVVLQVVAKDLD